MFQEADAMRSVADSAMTRFVAWLRARQGT